MTDLFATLLIKSTVVLALTGFSAFVLRRSSAAARHLVWLAGLCGLLILPLGALLPQGIDTGAYFFTAAGSATVLSAARNQSQWLPLLWLCGTALLITRLAFGVWRAARLIRSARSLSWAGDFEVRAFEERYGPLAWGFGRDFVLLPDAAGQWPDQRREAVVLHEAAHLRRKDCWALAIGELACALYWWHPLVWYAASEMRREQEHAADDDVLAEGVDASEYAGHLVAIARAVRDPVPLPGVVTRSELTARVEAILDSTRRRTMLTKRMALATAAALMIVALPIAAMQASRKAHKVGEGGVTRPEVIYREEAKYTDAAKEAKIEGMVVLSVIVETDGRPHYIEVTRSLHPGLDASAVAAVENWIFRPAAKDGTPVPVRAVIEMNFRLR